MALITYLTRIQFDFGALALLPDELQLIGMKRPLIVTDKGVVAAGLLERVTATLPPSVATALFDGTPANPTERAALAALDAYRAHDADGIIAIGGGSSMDLAKAVVGMATMGATRAVMRATPPSAAAYWTSGGSCVASTATALARSIDEPPPMAMMPSASCAR